MDGVIRVSWFYVHTGGLPLTDASVEYSYMSLNGSSLFIESVSVNETNTTVIDVSNLVAGFSYTFIITAENSNGSSTTLCRSILHSVGKLLAMVCLYRLLVTLVEILVQCINYVIL